MFIHTEARTLFFWVQNLNFNSFGVFRKNEYFWGYEDFADFLGGHHKIGLVLGVISMKFSVFSRGKCTECGYFWGLQKNQIFFGVLDIPDIFFG